MSEEQPKFNLDFLNQISGGDAAFIKEMVTTFKEMTPDFINNSENYLKEKNYLALSKEVHKFLPGVSFLGIKHIETELAFVEEYAKKEINLDKMEELLVSSIKDIEEIIDIFNKEFNLD